MKIGESLRGFSGRIPFALSLAQRRMTLEEFVGELALATTKFELVWTIGNAGQLRTSRRSKGTIDAPDCPLTAVCRMITGYRYGVIDWRWAASAIGLTRADARDVTLAADHDDVAKLDSPWLLDLRRRLVEATRTPEVGERARLPSSAN